MNVYRNTPIEQFAGSRGLSVRSLNVCRANGISTLGDLLQCDPDTLQGLRNCGTKSASELSALRQKYLSAPADLFSDILRRGLQQSFLRAKKRLPRRQAAIIENVMGSFGVDAKATGCFVETPYRFIDSVCNADEAMRSSILSAMSQLFTAWKIEASDDPDNIALLDANHNYVEQLRARYEAEEIYNSLPDAVRRLLSRRYSDEFRHLSVRTVNAMSQLSELGNALPYIFGTRTLDPQKLKNAGVRTLMEMRSFLSARKAELLKLFTSSKTSGPEWHERVSAMFAADIASRFPFLTNDEVLHVSSFEREGKPVPPLYLLERYVMHSESRAARIYALRYGIGYSKKMHCSDIGKTLGLSGERVRQLASSRLTLPDELEALLGDALSWLSGTVVGADDPAWEMEIRRSHLSLTVPQLMALATALRPDYITVQLTSQSPTWLVRRDILAGVNLKTTLRLLTQCIEMKRTRSETFDLAPYIFMGRGRSEFHPSVLDLCRIYLDCISRIKGVSTVGDDKFRVEANKLDIIAALEAVLDELGHSASYSELCAAFDKANPGQLTDTERQLRPYIFRSKRIASVGRSGRYVMRDWEGAFSGTVAQCMAMELKNAGEPLTANELHQRVSKFFPTTSLNSINVFAYLDKGRTIIMLPDRRYALAGQGYEDQQYQNRRSIPFDNRMDALKAFVGEFRRFPLLSDNDHVSLRRWLDNVRQGVVTLPREQRAELDEFLRSHTYLPSTSSQASFRRHVHSIMQHVCRHGAMPTPATGGVEYHWLQRVRQTRRPYGDLRDTDLMHLRTFLANFGYRI